MGSKLSFFPSPLPDELLLTLIGRYHILSGNRSHYRTLCSFWPDAFHESRSLWSLVPRNLSALAEILPNSGALSPHELAAATSIGLFATNLRQGIGDETVNSAMWSAKDLSEPDDRMIRRILYGSAIRICVYCAREDEARYGFPYIHRSHCLPGAKTCHKHGAMLIERCSVCGCPVAPTNDLTPSFTSCRNGHPYSESMPSQKHRELLDRLASLVHRLATELVPLPSNPRPLYDRRLVELGNENVRGSHNKTRSGRFLQSALTADLFEEAGYRVSLTHPYKTILGSDCDWPGRPMRHLVLIAALFESVNHLRQYAEQFETHASARSKERKRTGARIITVKRAIAMVTPLLKSGMSRDQIHSRTKCSMKIIETISHQILGTPLHPILERLVSDTEVAREIASGAQVRVTLKKHGFSTAWCPPYSILRPDVIPASRIPTQMAKRLDAHKQALLRYLDEHPGVSRGQLRHACWCSMKYVHTNDPAWEAALLARCKQRTTSANKDSRWDELYSPLLPRIEEAARAIRARVSGWERVTGNLVASHLGIESSRVLRALDIARRAHKKISVPESCDDFALRRARLTIAVAVANGIAPTRWLVFEAGVLTSARYTHLACKVDDYLEALRTQLVSRSLDLPTIGKKLALPMRHAINRFEMPLTDVDQPLTEWAASVASRARTVSSNLEYLA